MANEGLAGKNFFKEECVGIDATPISRGDRHEGLLPHLETAFLSFCTKRFVKEIQYVSVLSLSTKLIILDV